MGRFSEHLNKWFDEKRSSKSNNLRFTPMAILRKALEGIIKRYKEFNVDDVEAILSGNEMRFFDIKKVNESEFDDNEIEE